MSDETKIEHVEAELVDAAPGEHERRYKRYTRDEKLKLFDKILEKKYRENATWEEIGDSFGLARSTVRDWRATEEWRMAEARWRRILREEARSDATIMGQDALGVLQGLMHHARSEFVKYSAASKIIDIVGIGDEAEEAKADNAAQLNEFLVKLKSRAMNIQVIDGNVIDISQLEVRTGGLLPEAILEQGRQMVEEKRLEQIAMRKSLGLEDEDD